ncbi:MAG: aldolase [Candidatus Woesearchaeota archaeon]|jgi:DhnA family fructose-bisphosphate aldolase class Ia
MSNIKVEVPLDVPWTKKGKYIKNYIKATKNSGNLMLFAGDQKAEHLNGDFYGENISFEDSTPEHLFKIASSAKIGVFAAQLGLISKYGAEHKNVDYLVKMNSKSNLVKTAQKEPISKAWITVKDVVDFQKTSKLSIVGVGYTIYLGSEYETDMMQEASQIIREAHKNGLITVIWIYPRGKAVTDEFDPHLIAGATGTAACLGTDFVKVSYPKKEGLKSEEIFKEAVASAGKTKVVCAGGGSTDVKSFLETLHAQIHISGAKGNATGRNVHQKSFEEAVRFADAIYSITIEGKSVDDAMVIYNKKVEENK